MRGRVAVAGLLCVSACKIVHSTPGIDASSSGGVSVGFLTESTRVHEAVGALTIPVGLTSFTDTPFTVTYSVVDDTAIADVDYVASGGVLTFEPGQNSQPIPITIRADNLDEPDESFVLELESASGVTIGRRRHVVTIATNNVPLVSFETASSIASEGVAITVGLTLTEQSGQVVTVDYGLGGTATSADHQLAPGTVVFSPGSIRELIPLVKIDDSIDEDSETLTLTLIGTTNASIGPTSVHTHTINDNDPTPTVRFTQTAQVIAEGNTGTKVTTLLVTLSNASSRVITVPFSIEPSSTATAPDDYTMSPTSSVTFAPGTTAVPITITIVGDTTFEGSEDITIQLGTPTDAVLGVPQRYTVSIVNDECVGTGVFSVCPDGPLAAAITLPAELVTDTSPYCGNPSPPGWAQNGQPPSCIVFARSITVDSTRAWGSRPLVLVATDSITITSLLDASAHRGYGGPGSNPSACKPPPGQPGPFAGGAGGSFMSTGGNGGAHTNPIGPPGLAASADVAPPTFLRGGCPGQVGGDNFAPYTYGWGGGAVYLAAGTSITLQAGAIINASGEGARAGLDLSNGGSGGGSGGMIVLDAPTIQAALAYLLANGGGGAEGGTATKYGSDGGFPDPTTPFVPAPGGSGSGGGDGGSGFAQGSPAGNGASATNNSGGGGGGGGAGYIKTNQTLVGASVSPPPS